MKPIVCRECGSIAFRAMPNFATCLPCGQKRESVMRQAHLAVRRAVIAGTLPRPDSLYCIDCGGFATMYDHRDYLRQLDVEPVCRSCNTKRGFAPTGIAA